MIAFRLFRIILHILTALWTCAVVFPFVDESGRAWRTRHWSNQLLSLFRLHVEIEHHGIEQEGLRALVVANHVSWLDIFVINSQYPNRFVAKSEIRDWPVLGWLCAKAGTVFIARGRLRDVRRIFQDLVANIYSGEHVAFFPEGTTSLQGALLPFHPNLFEAAIDAQVPIQPYALRYINAQGEFNSSVDFVGDMTFVESMFMILRGDKITAQLIVLPLIDSTGQHRRELAQQARHDISKALGIQNDAASDFIPNSI